MKKILPVFILVLLIATTASAQDLLIRYDFVNKNIYYFKIKKHKDSEKLVPLKKPKIGPNGSVKIEYINMNPFIWNQPSVNLVSVEKDSVSSFNPFTMMLPGGLSDKLGSLGMSLTRDATALSPQQQVCLSTLRSLYDAYDEIDALKYNYKLTKEQILDQSSEKIKEVMKSCYASTGLDTTKSDFTKNDFTSMKKYFRDICQMEFPESRSANNSKADAFLGSAGIASNTLDVMPMDALNHIEKDYFTVSQADFSSENSFIVSDKDVVMHMNFTLTNEYRNKAGKDSVDAKKEAKLPQKVKDQSIYIPVTGGIRVSTSAGIGFTYVPSRKTYFLEGDSILAAAPDHSLVPVVGTFLNAYSRGLGVANFGGSFGIFVALQEVLSINYMFGVTTVFGRKERVLLTAGCVLAPIEEPTKGYYVGYPTDNPDFPVKLNYKPGFFFCLHYNIGKF